MQGVATLNCCEWIGNEQFFRSVRVSWQGLITKTTRPCLSDDCKTKSKEFECDSLQKKKKKQMFAEKNLNFKNSISGCWIFLTLFAASLSFSFSQKTEKLFDDSDKNFAKKCQNNFLRQLSS